MKKKLIALFIITILAAIALLLTGCKAWDGTSNYAKYENMIPPIIVVAKSERISPSVEAIEGHIYETDGTKGTIIIQDSEGTVITFMDSDKYGNALHASYEKGDTILTLIK